MVNPSEDWLNQINEKLRAQGVDPRQRPWLAVSEFSKEFGVIGPLDEPPFTAIWDWFSSRSRPDSQAILRPAESVFYYDMQFWLFRIPIVIGNARYEPLGAFVDLPPALRMEIETRRDVYAEFMAYFCSCEAVLYGGHQVRVNRSLPEFGRNLFSAGTEELVGAITCLRSTVPTGRPIQQIRMALELFMKSYLVFAYDWGEAPVKALSHRLGEAIGKCESVSGKGVWEQVRKGVGAMPEYHERYGPSEGDLARIWLGVKGAVDAGRIVVDRVYEW